MRLFTATHQGNPFIQKKAHVWESQKTKIPQPYVRHTGGEK